MSHFHAAVWLDHREARIFEIGIEDVDKHTVHAHPRHRQVHHKHGALGSGHAEGDAVFFAEIAQHLQSPGEVLIAGPGQAKLELMRYLHKHAPIIERKIMGVETVDHPTDGQLIAYARKYFDKADRLAPKT